VRERSSRSGPEESLSHERASWVLSAVCVLATSAGLSCARAAPDLSAVLVTIDAASARYLGTYGNQLDATPRLDALAEQSTVFERAYAQAPMTLHSTSSYLSGRYPSLKRGRVRLERPLAELLREAGLRTAAFSENPWVTRAYGLHVGFEDFREYFPFKAYKQSSIDFERRDSARTIQDVTAWLDAHAGERSFVYVHLLPPHAPYDPPAPFGGRFSAEFEEPAVDLATMLEADRGERELDARQVEHLRARYQENLAYADHQVGRLIDFLADRGRLDRTLLIVISDHGEAFMEHGRLLHNSTLYEEMIHVPLLIRFPPSLPRQPPRWSGVVELTDLLPTVCDALAIGSCEPRHGRSLLGRMAEEHREDGVARAWTAHRIGRLATLVLERRKLILDQETQRAEYYDLVRDPGESSDLAASAPDDVARLSELLAQTGSVSVRHEDAEIDARTRELLRSLGYAE